MPLLKPFRISNDHQFRPFALIQQHLNYTFQSTVVDCKDRYELRIYIPYVKEVDFSVFIEDHVLNINVTGTVKCIANEVEKGLSIFLPAEVKEKMVVAYVRPYGMKIILPKILLEKSGTKIKVPVLADH